MKKVRVKQNDKNHLWYLQIKTWYGTWSDVIDFYSGDKITDASWVSITDKADRWVFENLIKSNWRYHR